MNESFRKQEINYSLIPIIKEYAKEFNVPSNDLLAAIMIDKDFCLILDELDKNYISECISSLNVYSTYRADIFTTLSNYYRMIWEDIKCFPVAQSMYNEKATYSFDNSWMLERTYGGIRGHEGTDIMAGINKRGYYPILSMVDGTIENMGWLELGGYRLGIKTDNGLYLYYAHMYGYSKDLYVGKKVSAGEFLGYMGDTGYSKVEGTTGNFDVHLHVGMYLYDDIHGEISVNPYSVLKYAQTMVKTIDY